MVFMSTHDSSQRVGILSNHTCRFLLMEIKLTYGRGSLIKNAMRGCMETPIDHCGVLTSLPLTEWTGPSYGRMPVDLEQC